MRPFDFIITLLSFVYSLAIAHLLLGVARIVRHRRTVTLSWAHLVWTLNVLLILILNWLSLWDFRGQAVLSLGAIVSSIFFAVALFLVATFVTPDVEAVEDRNLMLFHERERLTYIGGALACLLLSMVLNIAASWVGVSAWLGQNLFVMVASALLLLALLVRSSRLQLPLALVNLVPTVVALILYYPRLG